MVDNKPNLFIVGAPKCGTSFLYEKLAEHPQIFMSPVKEPNYFDKDLNYISPRLTKDQYISLFKKSGSQKVRGEASPWYLYSSVAPKEIHQFNPDAKIIIMLRNPIDMMYSLHSEHLYQGNEEENDFGRALALEEQRKKGLNVYKFSNPSEGVYYKELATFSNQVKRYLDIFPRENVHIIIFEDVKANGEMVIQNVLSFLKVDTLRIKDQTVVNPNKVAKNKKLREMVLRPPTFFRSLIRVIVPIHGLRIFIQQQIIRMNTKNEKRKKLDSVLSVKLKKEMTEDVMKLSKLIGRDLSYWLKSE